MGKMVDLEKVLEKLNFEAKGIVLDYYTARHQAIEELRTSDITRFRVYAKIINELSEGDKPHLVYSIDLWNLFKEELETEGLIA